jgi:hypothetical protein
MYMLMYKKRFNMKNGHMHKEINLGTAQICIFVITLEG